MTPAYRPGTAVRVIDAWPEARGPAHIRTPHYIRGATGRVERCLGAFQNPEDLAFARPAPTVPLYHVRFPASGVWGDSSADELVVEVFEHWLEPAP